MKLWRQLVVVVAVVDEYGPASRFHIVHARQWNFKFQPIFSQDPCFKMRLIFSKIVYPNMAWKETEFLERASLSHRVRSIQWS